MAGRPRKPIELQLEKRRISKKTIAAKTTVPLVLGGKTLTMPPDLASDETACKMWDFLAAQYAGARFVSTADIGTIKRWCVLWSMFEQIRVDLDKCKSVKERHVLRSELMRAHRDILTLDDRLFLNPRSRETAMRPDPPAPKQSKFGEVKTLK